MNENKETENVQKTDSFSWGKEIWEWFYTIAIAVIIAMLIKTFLFDIVRVDGSSMYPTLENNDRLIVTKIGYKPQVDDIVILDSVYKKREAYYAQLAQEKNKTELSAIDKFLAQKDMPDALDKVYYVKRIIALPGQTVDVRGDGNVYVDGELVDEPFANGKTYSIDPTVEFPLTVEEGTVFVMGDNREHSKDSRASDLGLVPEDAILGKSQIRIWPFNHISFTR